MEVKRFSSYAACAAGVRPTVDALCEPGADAVDGEGANLTAAVLVCPPPSCLSTGCPGHQFAAKGLRGCVDTAAAVGSIFEVRFWVFDQQSPARNASATRTVVVVPPCAPGEQVRFRRCLPCPVTSETGG